MEKLEGVIFYALDKAIKTYRQFAQRKLNEAGLDITVDQWLVLNAINDHDSVSQLQIASLVFKDAASITRIIELLIKKGLIERKEHPQDKRRFSLLLTGEGKKIIKSISKIAQAYRAKALEGISEKELQTMGKSLQKITDNCNKAI